MYGKVGQGRQNPEICTVRVVEIRKLAWKRWPFIFLFHIIYLHHLLNSLLLNVFHNAVEQANINSLILIICLSHVNVF